ncbi:MAG: cytochrome c3 family protein [bacterium]|nr:cytochrome c3 family protein [bacterium]
MQKLNRIRIILFSFSILLIFVYIPFTFAQEQQKPQESQEPQKAQEPQKVQEPQKAQEPQKPQEQGQAAVKEEPVALEKQDISNEECVKCHFEEDPNLKAGLGSDIITYKGEKYVADEMMCYSCHDGSTLDDRSVRWQGMQHPMGMKPSEKVIIPPKFPLTKDGKLYCGSCHTPHAVQGSSNLRKETVNSSYCELCHVKLSQGKKTGDHPVKVVFSKKLPKELAGTNAKISLSDKPGEEGKPILICQTCHVVHGAPKGTEKLLVITKKEGGVSGPQLCEICHDNNPSRGEYKYGTTSHSIDVIPSEGSKIPDEWEPGKKSVKGDNGRLTCRTCHTPHFAAKESAMLVIDNKKGAFCQKCHTKYRGEGIKEKNTGAHPDMIKPKEDMKITKVVASRLEEGMVTCNTCHTNHNSAENKFPGNPKALLVSNNDNSNFCKSCHENDFSISKQDAEEKGNHPVGIKTEKVKYLPILKISELGGRLSNENQVVCNSCHRTHGGVKGTGNLLATTDDGKLCGYCHQDYGIEGLDFRVKMIDTTKLDLLRKGYNSSEIMIEKEDVHIDYSKVVPASSHPINRTSEFVKINKDILDAGGKLDKDNKIICHTCHKSHGAYKNTANLVMENSNSGFCRKCHKDKEPVLNSEHSLVKIAPSDKNIYGKTQAESGICGICHVAHGGTVTTMFSREIDTTLNDPVSEMCLSCHTKGKNGEKKPVGEYRHSTNIAIEETNRKETSLPLYDKLGKIIRVAPKTINKEGFVTCGSCHNVHQWDPLDSSKGSVENQEGGSNNSFLRMVYNKKEYKFCGECHIGYEAVEGTEHDLRVTAPKEKNSRGETAEESGVCESCHYIHNGNQANIWAKEVKGDADNVTLLCRESCHWQGKSGEKKLTGKNSHSVFVSMKFTDGETLLPLYDSSGRAVKGKRKEERKNELLVTCGSCHNVHQWDPEDSTAGRDKKNIEGTRLNSFLRIKDKEESELCMDCHANKPTSRTEHDMRVVAKDEKNILKQNTSESGICGACHIVHNAKDTILWSKELDTTTGKGGAITRECESCHMEKKCGEKKLIGKITHPIDCGLPGYEVVPTLPLYSDSGKRMWPKENEKNIYGNVTCASCHDSHQWDPNDTSKGRDNKNEEGNVSNSFLRMRDDSTSVLCGNCHVENVLILNTEHDLNVSAPKSVNVIRQTVKESGTCGACHLIHNGLELKLWARVPVIVEGDLIATLCFSCHSAGNCAEKKQTGKFSHPTGISIFEAGLTTSLPLFTQDIEKRVDGKMYCNTCHSVHQWTPSFRGSGPGVNTEGDGTNSFLRLRNDKESTLCLDCHQLEALMVNTDHDLSVTIPNEQNINKEVVAQSGSCSACHLPHNGGEGQRWAKPLGPGDDLVTKQCQSCHYEGKIAGTKVGTHSHPINVTISKKDMSTSLPLYTIDGKVDNVEGGISCLTCHFVHQWSPNQFEKQDRASGIFDVENIKSKIMGKIVHVSEKFSYIDPTGYPASRELNEGEILSIVKKKKIAAKLKVEKVNPFSANFKIFAQTLSIDEDVVLEVGDEVLDDRQMQKGLEGDGRNSFLRKDNGISTALCMDCHYKYIGTIGTDHDLSVTFPTAKNAAGYTVFESGICSSCHLAHGGTGRSIAAQALTVGQPDKEDLPVFKPLCYACHRDSGGMADQKKISVHHKIFKYPEYSKMVVIPTFPFPFYTKDDLLWKGKDDMYMSCATCHDPHQWDPEKKNSRHPIDPKTGKYVVKVEGDDTNSFLRMRNDKWQLCNSCHTSEVHLQAEEMLKSVGLWQNLGTTAVMGTGEPETTTVALSSTLVNKTVENIALSAIDATNVNLKNDTTSVVNVSLKSDTGIVMDTALAVKDTANVSFKKDTTSIVNVSLKSDTGIVMNTALAAIDTAKISLKSDTGVAADTALAAIDTTNVSLKSDTGIAADTANITELQDTTLGPSPEELALQEKPKVIAYRYERPIRISKDFRISITFSEMLNINITPKITLISDGKRSPVVPDTGGTFGTSEFENDTYITPPIAMEEDMGGNITIVVEKAEGVVENVMDVTAEHTFFFDTRPETLEFYRTAKLTVKEGSYTLSPEITLLMEAKGAMKVLISEDPGFKDATWMNFKPENKFMLSKGDGEKLIYVKYRKGDELETAPINVKVVLTGAKNESELRGTITDNIRLTAAGSPYIVRGQVNLPAGFSMTIEQGVKVLFDDLSYSQKQNEKGKLIIEGNLTVRGTTSIPVIFTSRKENPAPGDWEGISIIRSKALSALEGFILNYSKNGIYLEAAIFLIKNGSIEKCSESGVVCADRSDGRITECSIMENNFGVSVRQSNPVINKNTILKNKIGITSKAVSKPKIATNTIKFNEIGINCEEISSPWILDNLISENSRGIRCAIYSPPIIANNEITKNSESGIYIDEACPMVFKNIIKENKVGIQIENDYRKFLISYNNITNNIDYAVKMDKYIMQVNAIDNYWGAEKREIISKLIYDGNSIKEEVKVEKEVVKETFTMFSAEEKEELPEEEKKVKLGLVKYLPYQIEPIKDAGISTE